MTRLAVLGAWGIAGALVIAAVAAPDLLEFAEGEHGEAPVRAAAGPKTAAAADALKFPALQPPTAELLTRSPFDPSRSAFSREPALPPAPPPPPPRLLGISMKDGKRFATLEWPATGATQRVAVGDSTEVGKVATITASEVTINGKDLLKLSLFR